MTYLRLNGGAVVHVAITVEQLEDDLRAATASGALLKLRSSDGRQLLINPAHIVYAEERRDAPEESAGGSASPREARAADTPRT